MSVELLSPAGNLEKLRSALEYGADAAYLGFSPFSLRTNAGNFTEADLPEVIALKEKTGKKLYCTVNMLFDQNRMALLEERMPEIKKWPFDGFIVSDLGVVPLLRRHLGDDVELHLSTQASCTNSESARFYHRLGFKRIILGREASLDDIRAIRDRNPDLELEVFVHGAMCMAYSGRCLLSAHLAGRSGNRGDCSHSCRWNYRLALEEKEREGTFYPIEEYEDYTTILSSKDLCMIDHLDELVDAGVSALKIEGRMKSSYYVAVVTRAYRKALDKDPRWERYREDLFDVSHREYSTGFFFGSGAVDPTKGSSITGKEYLKRTLFCGFIRERVADDLYRLELKNSIKAEHRLTIIAPDLPDFPLTGFTLLDENLKEIPRGDHGRLCYLRTGLPVREGYMIRRSL
ncbi:MAG: U32 family peptidase [Spirochaetales bacterium]|nr:U32 family peptidase [Spirochaetales bacterium]